jgi:hypothetical protein
VNIFSRLENALILDVYKLNTVYKINPIAC